MSEEVQGNLSHRPAEPKTQNKNEDNEEVRVNSSHGLPEWLEEFKDHLVDECVPEHRTLPVLLMNYLQSREQKWYQVSTAFLLTSQRTEIATSA